ncbi:cytochrome c biogenesis protein CcdA [Anaerolineales bacterium HSG6]|nr:cytochrome c biogenesis protein CcdA [Anaerolineales bacterium HSG6]
MVGIENVTFFAAFLAGFLSFISPCVLPLIPVYLGYLTGSTISGEEPPPRQFVFAHALMFVAGFTFIFVTFGALAGFLGAKLFTLIDSLVLVGGILLILFGLHLTGIITIPMFNVQKKFEYGHGQTPGYLRSMMVGMTFAAGWTPCIGPLLGAILTLAATGQNVGLASAYLFVYSMGLAIPFLVTAWMLSAATSRLRMLNQYMGTIERFSGAFIIIIGILLVTGQFTILNNWANQFVPEWLIEYS